MNDDVRPAEQRRRNGEAQRLEESACHRAEGARADSTDTQSGTLDAMGGTMAQRPATQIDTYAFVIGETDLMTGVGIQGWRIVKVNS